MPRLNRIGALTAICMAAIVVVAIVWGLVGNWR